MNNQEDTLDTNSGFTITVRRAPIKYVGPKEEKPTYVEVAPKPKREVSEAHRLALSVARKGKTRGPYNKGESK